MELREFIELLNRDFLGNPLRAWLFALLFSLTTFVALRLVLRLLRRHVRKIAAQTATRMDDLALDLLASTKRVFVLIWCLYFWSKPLKLPVTADRVWDRVAILALVLQSAVWGARLIQFWLDNYFNRRVQEDVATATTVGLIRTVSKAVLYSFLALVALNNFGVDVTALVAGLGVGGIAVALAAQNILGDLFASLTIVLDKPFSVGDYIVVGDLQGTVEEIGLKTSRIRSLSGEQLIFPNADLLQSRVRNFKRMRERRVALLIGVTYETPLERLKEVPGIIRSALAQHEPKVRVGRSGFKEFGASSLNFETEYWVQSPDAQLAADIQQAVGFELIQKFGEKGIEFAYPTQTLLVRGQPAVLPS
jgi:small-conductance mechanosensitive channel